MTSIYITLELIMNSVFKITYPKPFLTCHDQHDLNMMNHQHFQNHNIDYLQTYLDDKGSKPFGQQFLISPMMILNIKHHNKVTFFELLLFHLLIKSFFYWTYATLMNWKALNWNSSNSLSCNNRWHWNSSKGSFIVVAMCKVITLSSMGRKTSIP